MRCAKTSPDTAESHGREQCVDHGEIFPHSVIITTGAGEIMGDPTGWFETVSGDFL